MPDKRPIPAGQPGVPYFCLLGTAFSVLEAEWDEKPHLPVMDLAKCLEKAVPPLYC